MEHIITLKDLVMQADKEGVVSFLTKIYLERWPKTPVDSIRKAVEEVLECLKAKEPTTSEMELRVCYNVTTPRRHRASEKELEPRVVFDVSGINGDMCYSLVATEWSEWLGMPVRQDTLDALTVEQIVGCCIYEMTYFGWTEEEINKRITRTSNG